MVVVVFVVEELEAEDAPFWEDEDAPFILLLLLG
jgi:hypothetical protein